MTVVSNSTPLINLARVVQLDLLPNFYKQIVIPEAVHLEVVVAGRGRDGSREVEQASWIKVLSPRDEFAVRVLAADLGPGEASALILAEELGARLVLLDEIRARRVAQRLGFGVRGTLGILARAKREGYVSRLKPVLDLLRARGTWLSQELYDDVLRLANE